MAFKHVKQIVNRSFLSIPQKKTLKDALEQTYADNNDVSGDLHLDIGSGEGIKIGEDPTSDFGWADIEGPIEVRGVAATDPNWSIVNAGPFYAYKFAVNDYVFISYHVPHDIVPGADLHIHCHWFPDGTDVNPVKWEWYYTYALGFNQAAFSTAGTLITAEQAGPGVAWQHMITETAAITIPTLTEPDGYILTRLRRVTNGAVENADDIFVITSDIHYQSTGLVSTKNKAPNFYA